MNRTILFTLIATVIFLGVTFALRQAGTLGYLSEETVRRSVQVMIGLGLAAWSNFTPKQIGVAGSPQAEAWKQRLLRVIGWSMVLAGVSYAGLWAFTPFHFANTASIVVVVTALAVTLGYMMRANAACRKIASQQLL